MGEGIERRFYPVSYAKRRRGLLTSRVVTGRRCLFSEGVGGGKEGLRFMSLRRWGRKKEGGKTII